MPVVLGSLVSQLVKNLPVMPETWVWSLGCEDLLEKEKATHSSILAWRIPWTESKESKESDTTEWLSLSLPIMNIDAEILTKLLANQIQQYIMRIIYHDQVKVMLGIYSWLNTQPNRVIHPIKTEEKEPHDHIIVLVLSHAWLFVTP